MVLKKKKVLRVSDEEIEFLGEIYQRMKKDKEIMSWFKTFEKFVEVYLRTEGYKIIDLVEFKLKEAENGKRID
jgi:hypothetical protein